MDRRAEGFERLLKTSGPTLLGLASVFFISTPIRPLGGLMPVPCIPLIVVFYWSVRAPEMMSPVSVFFIGLAQDFLSGGPLGLWPFAYLCVQYLVLSQRGYFSGRDMQVLWAGFAAAALTAFVLIWLVSSVFAGVLLNPAPVAAALTTTALLYPLFSVAFALLHLHVLRER